MVADLCLGHSPHAALDRANKLIFRLRCRMDRTAHNRGIRAASVLIAFVSVNTHLLIAGFDTCTVPFVIHGRLAIRLHV